jgi:Uncharacterized protein with SCP/PR1 domains
MRKAFHILFIVVFCALGHTALAEVKTGRGQVPQRYSEKFTKNKLYFSEWTFAYQHIDSFRKKKGLPPLAEDEALGRAAYAIANEMRKQDWPGLPLPDGKDLAFFLKKAGYRGDSARVHPYVFISDSASEKGDLLSFKNLPSAMRWVAGPFAKSFAYTRIFFENAPKYDYNTRTRRALVPAGTQGSWLRIPGNYGEIVLIGEDAPDKPDRTIRPGSYLQDFYKSQKQEVITLRLKKGKRVEGIGLVGGGAKVVGRMKKVRGRLPKGVRIDAKTGKLRGIPRSRGRYTIIVKARYRIIPKGMIVTAPLSKGVHTNKFVIVVGK